MAVEEPIIDAVTAEDATTEPAADGAADGWDGEIILDDDRFDEDDELEIDLGFIELDEKDLEFLGIYISVCEALEK